MKSSQEHTLDFSCVKSIYLGNINIIIESSRCILSNYLFPMSFPFNFTGSIIIPSFQKYASSSDTKDIDGALHAFTRGFALISSTIVLD